MRYLLSENGVVLEEGTWPVPENAIGAFLCYTGRDGTRISETSHRRVLKALADPNLQSILSRDRGRMVPA